ncbi:hypothetical protein JK636_04435 [Clostridium sp. YIM B02515]|uniref:Uncharacterized protein n=1 Tax=Clostridium rhizosphaerae TaxID=2803861 RepID=A0ABS1TAH1_9CLOT|nr:hypothetical protein [Clostridium rhizosphaerae]MBL4935003.1 hypothetical protein [Clostridium rhizosphaerae]
MVLKAQSTSRKNKNNSNVEFLDVCDIDDEGFIEGDINTGKVLSSFSFEMSAAPNDNKAIAPKVPAQAKSNEPLSLQSQTYSSAPRGLTPPINGENFTVKRSYAMRPSTVRKLNALKAEHPNVNVLFNTIVDMAISYYYNYIFNFSLQDEKKLNS